MEHSIYGGLTRIGLLIVLVGFIGSCSAPPKRLGSNEIKLCRAQGGYESRAPFGNPFCQFHYSDAGKACSGKIDCEGRCLFQFGSGRPKEPKVGDGVAGTCEAAHSTFGCYGTVEGGKLATDEGCTD